MKYNRLSILAVCLSAFSMVATAQNVTLHKQGGVGQVYEVEKVDSVIYFPVGDAEQFPAPEVENTTTLWDVIKAQPNLKKFAAILEAASYYTGKGKASTGLQFSQLLAGSVPLSVYAPTDAAISEEIYAELQALAKTDGWKLQQEFVFQHISAQENEKAGGDGTKMLNGKIIGLDAIDVTPVSQECNNGKLYTVPFCLPYLANMKEYLFDLAPGCAVAQQFMAGFGGAGKAFDAANSISVPSKDGNMQALDSVFSSHNRMMDPYIVNDDVTCIKGFSADLADENASYSMVMPTDQVWNDAQAKLTPLYNYAAIYEDKVRGDQGTKYIFSIDRPDSIAALSVGADILVPLFGRTASGQETKLSNGTAYTVSEWPIPVQEYKPDVEVEIEHSGTTTTVYKATDPLLSDYCVIRDYTNNTNISELEAHKQIVDVFYNTTGSGSKYRVGAESYCLPFNNDKFAEITEKYGRVSNNNFYYLESSGPTAGPKAEIKLRGKNGEQIMSGKYDIQIVIVPYWYKYLFTLVSYEISFPNNKYEHYYEYVEDGIPEEWRDETGQISEQVIDSLAASTKQKFRVQVSYTRGAMKDNTSSYYTGVHDGLRVDTITVAEDFEFPYTYKNIPRSYPILFIDGTTNKTDLKNGYICPLCIDKIILKSKEDGNEIEVTP